MNRVGFRLYKRRAHRLARRRITIQSGEWLGVGLGMPTYQAILLKYAYEIQQGRCDCDRCKSERRWDARCQRTGSMTSGYPQ